MKFKLFLITLLLIFAPLVSSAQISFGGYIIKTIPCYCSGGLYILVFNFVTMTPTPIVFQYGVSRLNESYNIFTPGVQLLGTYTPGATCMFWTGKACIPLPVFGTITPFPLSGVGTSLTPGF